MIESQTHKNNLLRLRQFDKCCIFVKNSVYLKSLIDLLMSPALQPCPSYAMALRAPLHPKAMISGIVFFALSLVCPLSPSFQNGRHPWRRQARHHEQEVCLEDSSLKGPSYLITQRHHEHLP